MVATPDVTSNARFNERFAKLIRGHWLDSIGNSIIVSKCKEEEEIIAVLTPLIDHPDARDKVLLIKRGNTHRWRCGNANLEWADEQHQRLVWVTQDGRRSVWSRNADDSPSRDADTNGEAFPWLLNNAVVEPWLPTDVPRDILYDGARVAALLDIRQMIGPRSEPQERLTHILMDHDLHPSRGDYLIPGSGSPLWQTLPVSDSLLRSIAQRIHRIPHEAMSQNVSWSGETEVHVGRHKISCRARDIATLESRWVLPPKDERKPLEIARLLALYSVFDNPLSNRRNGVHLGLDPEIRHCCDYELFASPLNACVPNGRFASKWPHVEWRFGSIGSYPAVMSFLPVNSVVAVNPPFTEAYLADVMARLAELKLRFRLRIAIPIQEMPWRKKLQSSMPGAQLLTRYYDASSQAYQDLLHPTLLWEDPRCPQRHNGQGDVAVVNSAAAALSVELNTASQPVDGTWPGAAAALDNTLRQQRRPPGSVRLQRTGWIGYVFGGCPLIDPLPTTPLDQPLLPPGDGDDGKDGGKPTVGALDEDFGAPGSSSSHQADDDKAEESPKLNAQEWPDLSSLKAPSKKANKVKR